MNRVHPGLFLEKNLKCGNIDSFQDKTSFLFRNFRDVFQNKSFLICYLLLLISCAEFIWIVQRNQVKLFAYCYLTFTLSLLLVVFCQLPDTLPLLLYVRYFLFVTICPLLCLLFFWLVICYFFGLIILSYQCLGSEHVLL